jgi:hypothetical protein
MRGESPAVLDRDETRLQRLRELILTVRDITLSTIVSGNNCKFDIGAYKVR